MPPARPTPSAATRARVARAAGDLGAAAVQQTRTLLEPTLTPATYASVKMTHMTSDLLALAALIAMEFRRRRLTRAVEVAR